MRQKFCLFLVFLLTVCLLSGCGEYLMEAMQELRAAGETTGETTGTAEPLPQYTAYTVPTESTESTDRNPVPVENPYRDYYDFSTGFLLPEADTRYYFRTELTQTDRDWLRVARNEIYARHGYVFKDQKLADYFSAMPWYEPIPDKDPSGEFNKYEKHNVMLLGMVQDLLDGKKISLKGKNPYLAYYDPEMEFILTWSDEDVVERAFLRGMSKEALKLARNEIFARHGYYFSNEDLLTYFAMCSWYYPDPAITTTDNVHLGSQEKKNVSVIKAYEKNPDYDPSGLDTKLSYSVTTDYFSLKLPAYWKTAADYYYSGDYIEFVQEACMDTYGGHLFSIGVYESMEDIEYHPSYFKIGTVSDTAGNTYYVVVTEPTDVQFDSEDDYIAGEYQYMQNEQDRILDTIKGANGYTFKAQ